ncbi:MAG: hypothetical protein AB7K09_01535 [Planctomycetota bacterium]
MHHPMRDLLVRALTALLLIAAALPALTANADDQRVIARLKPGFNGHWRQYRWAPVVVTLRSEFNTDIEAFVTLERRWSEDTPRVVLKQRIMLQPPLDGVARQSTLIFYVPPLVPGEAADFVLTVTDRNGNTLLRDSRIETREREDGTKFTITHWDQPRANEAVSIRADMFHTGDRVQLVLSVSDDMLPGQRDIDWHKETQGTRSSRNGEPVTPYHHILMLRGDASELPDEWSGYDMLDAVYLANPDWAVLKDRNRYNALRTWVCSGGHLILALSENLPNVRASAMDDDCGVQVDEAIGYSGPSQLQIVGSSHELELGTVPQRKPMSVLKVTPLEGTRVVVRTLATAGEQGGIPMVVQRPLGLGQITLFLFDPTQRELTTASDAMLAGDYSLARFVAENLLGDTPRDSRFPASGADDVMLSNPYREQQPSLVSPHQLMQDRATLLEKAEPVSFKLIALFLGIYVLVIGPLDYLVLGLFNMRGLTWFTFTFAAITFFILAERGTEQIRGGEMVIRQTTVLTFDGAGQIERGDIFCGIFPQNNATEVIWVDRANARVARLDPGIKNSFNYGLVAQGRRTPNQATAVGANSVLAVWQPNDVDPARHDKQLYLKTCSLTRWSIRAMTATYVDTAAERRLALEQSPEGRYRVVNRLGLPLAAIMAVRADSRGNLQVAAHVTPTTDATIRTLETGDSWDLPLAGRGTDRLKYDNWRDLRGGEDLFSEREMVGLDPVRYNADPPKVATIDPLRLSVPSDVAYMLIATFADRLRGGRNADYFIESGQTRGVCLDETLDRGAIVVIGWTDPLLDDAKPLEGLRVEGWSPMYEHRSIVRMVIWPDEGR